MTYNLLDYLRRLKEFRRKEGLRYPLAAVLSMCIMAILSGAKGYREFARFMKANKSELVLVFRLKHGVPSHVTIREILQKVDLKELTTEFAAWMSQYHASTPEQWVSVDGKALGSTVKNPHNELQNFVSVVSFFGHQSGLVYTLQDFDWGKSYEPHVVRQLIENLGLEDLILTLDAVHCQKKH